MLGNRFVPLMSCISLAPLPPPAIEMGKQSKVEKHYEMEKGKDDKNLREKRD